MLGELIFFLRSFHGFLASSGPIGTALAWLISFKPVLFALLLLLLLLSNWLVKQEHSWALSQPQEEAETAKAPEVCPNNVSNKEELEKMNACVALQDKVLERLMLSEMKLKALENQIFIIWNKINRRRRRDGRPRNFSRRRHPSRRNDSTFSTMSKCTTITPTECD